VDLVEGEEPGFRGVHLFFSVCGGGGVPGGRGGRGGFGVLVAEGIPKMLRGG